MNIFAKELPAGKVIINIINCDMERTKELFAGKEGKNQRVSDAYSIRQLKKVHKMNIFPSTGAHIGILRLIYVEQEYKVDGKEQME